MVGHIQVGRTLQKPGQPLVYDKWCWLEEYDSILHPHWIAVMQQMDAAYKQETTTTLREWICRRRKVGARAYFYAGTDFAVAIRFDYVAARELFRVLSFGFTGSLSPPAALDMSIEVARRFLHEVQAMNLRVPFRTDAMIAVHPKRMDSVSILELYGIIRSDPRLRVTVEAESDLAVRLRIESL